MCLHTHSNLSRVDRMDVEARTYMALAATYAGIGFGNAGVHVPHAIAYPIAGMVKNFSPPDYPNEEPMILMASRWSLQHHPRFVGRILSIQKDTCVPRNCWGQM